jgi:hypothetical protein
MSASGVKLEPRQRSAADEAFGGHSSILEWLVGDECHELDDAGLVAGLGTRLRAAGLPIDPLALHLRTLHTEISGRRVAWAPNESVEVRNREHGIETSALFVGSPLQGVMETREPMVVRLDKPGGPAWTQLDVFAGCSLVQIVIVPLCSAGGLVTMDDIVEEVVYVTDMDAAFAVAGEVRAAAYGGRPVVASTILVTPRLAFPDQLIEIKVIAKV